MQIPNLLAELDLTPENSVVIGSGVLNALNLRASKDVDVVVTEDAYGRLSQDPRFTEKQSHGRTILVDDVFEIGTFWGVLGKNQTLDDLFEQSTVIEGVRYITPQFLLAAKQSWLTDAGRPKDFADVRLIEDYLSKRASGNVAGGSKGGRLNRGLEQLS